MGRQDLPARAGAGVLPLCGRGRRPLRRGHPRSQRRPCHRGDLPGAGVRRTAIRLVALAIGLAFQPGAALASPFPHRAFPGANGSIAFASDRAGHLDIWTVNPDGTGLTRLTSNSAADVQPAWSANGMKVAFTSYRPGNGGLYTLHADDTHLTRLTSDGAFDGEPAWSP